MKDVFFSGVLRRIVGLLRIIISLSTSKNIIRSRVVVCSKDDDERIKQQVTGLSRQYCSRPLFYGYALWRV